MSEKTEARLKLEKDAADLGLTFPANIGDEKLEAKIVKARAKLDDHSNSNTPNTPAPPADQAQKAGDADTIVFCAVAGGRRRAGRRFDGGENPVKLDELSEAELAAIDADPLLTMKPISQE